MNVAVRPKPAIEAEAEAHRPDPRRTMPRRKSEFTRSPQATGSSSRESPPWRKIRSVRLIVTTTVLVIAAHGTVIGGLGYLRPEPPAAIESIELTFVAQGDPVPEQTKAQEVQTAQEPTPPEVKPDPTQQPPDPTPPPPVEPPPTPPPPVETPPPPPVEVQPPVVTPAPPPVDDPPPPPPAKAVEEAVPIETPPPPPPPPPVKDPPKLDEPPAPPVVEPPRPKPVDPAPKVDPPKAVVKPKPKSHPVVKEKRQAQEASEVHKVGVADGKAADLGMTRQTYNAILLAQISEHKVYPDAARVGGVTGQVGVSFTIGAAGTASGITISQSSGSSLLDEAARQAVRAIHTPPPPGGPFSTTVHINFTLH